MFGGMSITSCGDWTGSVAAKRTCVEIRRRFYFIPVVGFGAPLFLLAEIMTFQITLAHPLCGQ